MRILCNANDSRIFLTKITIQLWIYVNLKLHKALALFQPPNHGIFSKLVKQTYLFLHKYQFPTLMMTALRTAQLSRRFCLLFFLHALESVELIITTKASQGDLFHCSPEINWLVPLLPENRFLYRYIPCSQYCLCSSVTLKIWPLFPVPLK